jgi:hypothetical protein
MNQTFSRAFLAWLTASDFSDKAGRVYFESLCNRYRQSLPAAGEAVTADDVTEEIRRLEEKYDKTPESITMANALRYERLAVRRAPSDQIPAILESVQSHYKRFCTATEFADYLKVVRDTVDPRNPATQRSEIESLIGKIQDIYVLAPFREHVRGQLSMRISGVLVICVGAILLVCLIMQAANAQVPWWLLFVAISGAVGGLVSVHQRIQSLTVAGDAIRGALALCNGWFSVYFAPVIGAVSATILALLFQGGMIQGDLFPKAPFVGPQLAKMIVWGFVAGFIERLVPGTLTRLSDAVSGQRFSPSGQSDGVYAARRSDSTADHRQSPTGGVGTKGSSNEPKTDVLPATSVVTPTSTSG